MKKLTTEEFIARAKLVHGDKYDYSKTVYKGAKEKVQIFCKSCNAYFWQTPDKHLRGYNCNINYRLNKDSFIERAKKIHDDEYDYSKVKYINYDTRVCIICSNHGEFWQTPNDHLSGSGCPICSSSKGEKVIENYLIKEGIIFERQKKFDDLKDKSFLSFDFFLPKENILIEYNGIQHYMPINFGNCSDAEARNNLKIQRHHDWLKRKYCLKKGIKLIVIKYNEEITAIRFLHR